MLIYHVALPSDWAKYQGRPSYQTESLQTEGFIHCSYSNQLPGVLKRYFSKAGKVVVLTIDTEKLRSKLIAETSSGGESFPHIYGRLNHDAVISVEERDLRSPSGSLADLA
ncbi:MAG TPA: DUF952 domain-containing protein [Pyrinomonadaceae bacterium]|nr:DUF952 domain-containing protein [Pyrinomonadaceae bacterium]